MTHNRIFGLDLMRSNAILLVCLLHARDILLPFFPNFPAIWLVDGVDLFFCLSGFLIGQIFILKFKNKKEFLWTDFKEFWKRRWFRTLPAYYLILILNILLFYYNNQHIRIENLWKYLFFLQNIYDVQCFHFFTESWSLAVEEWFYLILPVFCYLVSKLFLTSNNKSIFIVIIFILVTSIIIRNYKVYFAAPMDVGMWIKEFRSVVLFRLDTIMYGVLGAYLSVYKNDVWVRNRKECLIIGLLFIFTLEYLYPINTNFLKVNSDTFKSISILLLLPYLSNWQTTSIPILNKFVVFISKISYGMYLVNASLIFNILNLHFKAETSYEAILNYFLFWLLTISFSYVLYRYFEKPIMNLRDTNIRFNLKNSQSQNSV